MKILNTPPIILIEKIVFQGDYLQLKEQLKKANFKVAWEARNQFYFQSNWSLGVIQGISAINGYGILVNSNAHPLQIELRTKIRPELCIMFAIALVFLLAGLVDKTTRPFWFFPLLPILLIWPWLIYRVQEKILFRKVTKLLTQQ